MEYRGLTPSGVNPLRLEYTFTDGLYTKSTHAHTYRELIREWLWEPKGSSLGYIQVLGGGESRPRSYDFYAPARRPPCAAGAATPTVWQQHAFCLSVMIAALHSQTVHTQRAQEHTRTGN